MNPLTALAERLERLEKADRRLDSEIVAAALGPPGCAIDIVAGLDGWDIETAPDQNGEASVWLEAADVGHVTCLIEDAIAFIGMVRSRDGVSILARVLRTAPSPPIGATLASYAQRMSCWIVAEALRAIVNDRGAEDAQPFASTPHNPSMARC